MEGLLSTGPTPSSFFLLKKNGQNGGASRWRVCYQPRLVLMITSHLFMYFTKVTKSRIYQVYNPLFD